MKILHVATSLDSWGGIEKYIAGLSEELMRRGHELYCTTMPGSPLDEHFPGTRIPVQKDSRFDLATFREHRQVIRERGIEVVNVHFTPDLYVGGFAARMAGCRNLVMTRHVAEPWSRVKAFQYGKTFGRIVAVSDVVREILLESGVPAEKVSMARAGIKPVLCTMGREAARRELGFEGFVFGFVGRLTREKGVDVAIQAALLTESRLEIFGEGPEREALEALVGGSPLIRFHGFTERISIPFCGIDCLLVPSRWAEAFPLAVLEAMSISKPIIASEVGGLPEMIQDGLSGILVSKEDPQALGTAMRTMSSDVDLAVEMGKTGFERFEREFTLEKMGDRFEALYLGCVSGSGTTLGL